MDVVIHLAVLPSVPRSIEDPLTTNDVNVTGTLNVALAARDAGVRRVVIASSSSVYGRNDALPKVDTLVPMPISPYSVSKLAAEQYCMGLSAVYGVEAVALRYFNVFGARQDPNSQDSGVIPKFLTRAAKGEPLVINGDGTQSRDFTYIDNVVAATASAGRVPLDGSVVCNIGCGGRHTLNDLAETAKIAGRDVPIEFGPPRAGDVMHSFAVGWRARSADTSRRSRWPRGSSARSSGCRRPRGAAEGLSCPSAALPPSAFRRIYWTGVDTAAWVVARSGTSVGSRQCGALPQGGCECERDV
jgi:nucleoside-diphosphate-sugar epimerase